MRSTIALLAAGALVCGGCRSASFTANDSFIHAGEPSLLSARLEHNRLGDVHGLANLPVNFFVDDRLVGTARTDAMGDAVLMSELPAGTTCFIARAEAGGKPLESRGTVFGCAPGRTMIVCDVDETISMTDYRALLAGGETDMGSTPFPGAAAALTRLRERYELVYLTARPAFLHEKTRRWLREHGFPPAALITAPTLRETWSVQKFKAATIARLQRCGGALVIGIGNANTDSEAYASRGLLTLIIDSNDNNRFRSHAVILPDWAAVCAFFDANRELLESPAAVRAALENQTMIRRPLIRYTRRS